MALHERFDPAGRRILLTDKERREHDAGEALLLVGLAAALCAPGFLVERHVCPLLGGCAWLLVGVLLSGAFAYGLCVQLGTKGGLVIYVLLAAASAFALATTEPTTYRRYEAEQRGLADAAAGKRYEFHFAAQPEYEDLYGEAYKRGVLARADRRVTWSESRGGRSVDLAGEVVDFSYRRIENRAAMSADTRYAYHGEYGVRTADGEVRREAFVEFVAKTR